MVLLLEIARGLAALWVFLFHISDHFATSSPVLYAVANIGGLGVPMFFIISGYVITCSGEATRANSQRSALDFLWRRLRRIYPTFWCSVIVVLLLPYLLEVISMLKTGTYQPPEALWYQLDFSQWLHFLSLDKVFFAQHGDLQGEFNMINSVYWSLAIEVQFYLVVFLALCVRRYYRWVIGGVSVFSLINLGWPVLTINGLFIDFWPLFALGAGVAYLHKYHHRLSQWSFALLKVKALMLGWLLAGVILLQLSSNLWLFGLWFAGCLWLTEPLEKSLVSIKDNSKHWFHFPLQGLLGVGMMSYTIYLLHGKLYALPSMFTRQFLPADSLLNIFIVMVATVLLCIPFYRFIERRFMSQRYQTIHHYTLTKVSPSLPDTNR